MRIYGSSPLFNYVDLVFRCKRMFIVAILLCTVVTTLVAQSRSALYTAELVISLTGDAEATKAAGSPGTVTAVERKTQRLVQLWLPKDPTFLPEVIRNLKLVERSKGKTEDELLRDLRKKIEPESLDKSGQYISLTLSWDNPDDAEKILTEVYSLFARKTVQAETAFQTTKLQMLEEQYKKYDAIANEQAKKRVAYLQQHYWQNPSLLGTEMGVSYTAQQQIADAERDLADNQSRLAEIDSRLKTTPERVIESERKNLQVEDPAQALQDQKKDLELQLQQLRQRYTDLAPKNVEVMKRIAAIDLEIAAARGKPAATRETDRNQTTVLNQEYVELHRLQGQTEMDIRAKTRQLEKLHQQLSTSIVRLKAMPEQEVEYLQRQRDYNLADNVRNQLRGQLYAAKLDKERDEMIQARQVKEEYPPKAEKEQSGVKGMALYLLGPILGIVIAFCFSLLAEVLDHSLRTPVEVERHLGKPVLAVLPRIPPVRESRRRLGGDTKPSISS